MNILVLNAGSSTLKYQLFAMRGGEDVKIVAKGAIDRVQNMGDATRLVFETLGDRPIDALGYRVVHGGDRFDRPVRIDSEVVREIRTLIELAPLHNSVALQCIEAGMKAFASLPGVAVFDTSFHRTMPEVARRYAIDRALADRHGLHRFGFHGISHEYVSKQLLCCMGRNSAGRSRLITCHLGSGASICAVRDGQSIDTSMGLTPLEGLVMGTRGGDVDPGLVLHLLRVVKMSADEIDDLLNHKSGLLGLSQRSADARDLETASGAGDANAEAALEAFAYRCRKYIGAYAAALGGVDGIAFAGGIGEHSPSMRARIVRNLDFLGVHIDPDRNGAATGDQPASIGDGKVAVWVIPTDEERQVAEEVFTLCQNSTQKDPK